MTGWPSQPVIYEINTAVWLNELAQAAGRRVTLAGVAAADWDAVTPAAVDAGHVLAHGRDPLFVALGPWQFYLLGLQ
jgi:hypothetical protein